MDSQLMSALEAIRARGARVCRNAKRGDVIGRCVDAVVNGGFQGEGFP